MKKLILLFIFSCFVNIKIYSGDGGIGGGPKIKTIVVPVIIKDFRP